MSSVALAQFEWLSNEILLDIFVYLDAYHMCQAFYGLNARLDSLIQWGPLHFRCDGSMADRIVWDAVATNSMSSQIRVLSCFGDMRIDPQILQTSMKNLRTIVLYNMILDSIDEVCKHLSANNQIKCLSVQSRSQRWSKRPNQSLSHCILVDYSDRFLSLTHLSLDCCWQEEFPVISTVFPQLRYFSLTNFQFSNDLLHSLQNNMPNLRSFKFQGSYNSFIPSPIIIKQVHELALNTRGDALVLQSILFHFPSLRRLHIECEYYRGYFILDGPTCQQLVEEYLPHLKQLTIDYNPGTVEEILATFYNSDFWSKRLVKVTTETSPAHSQYTMIKTISVGKKWRFHYFDNLNLTKLISC